MEALSRNPMLPTPVRVRRVSRETGDTRTLSLEPPDHTFSFAPGQFNMLYAFGVGEIPISMSGDPARPDDLVHTIKAVGAVSEALCRLRAGSVVGLRGPFGQPWPMTEVKGADLVLVAGGLGFAPLRPVFYHVLSHRRDFGEVSLLVGARTPEDLLFRKELEQWKRSPGLRVLDVVDRAGGGWKGRVGVVTALFAELMLTPRATAFVCGPELMMRFAIRELLLRGVAEDRIYVSMERNMKCAVGFCGHCQWGPAFVCKDGPVFRYDRIRDLFWVREI